MAIAISVLLGAGLLLVAMRSIFSHVRKRLAAHVQARFDKDTILGATTRANCFGEKSRGGRQIRGNGALVLTKDEIVFVRALPLKEVVISLKSITDVSLPTSFNGKSVFSELLCIQYATRSGSETMAWAINNPESWKASIETLIATNQ